MAHLRSWREARRVAESAEWTAIGTGDWAWVYGLDDMAWRISPFDPAFRYFAEVCITAQSPHLPHVTAIVDHPDGGNSVLMELLEPVEQEQGRVLLETFQPDAEGPHGETRRLLEQAAARARLPLFEGLDLNPNNLLRRSSDGSLVLTDAFWINGLRLYELVQTEPAAALSLFGTERLRRFAHIPAMDPPATERILRAIDRP